MTDVLHLHPTPGSGAAIPCYGTLESVGLDLSLREDLTIEPGAVALGLTGLLAKAPDGHWLMMAARSSLSKRRLMLANSLGVIDPDYCGPTDELKVPLYNFGAEPVTVRAGERVAQLIIMPLVRKGIHLHLTSWPFESDRGGFGSTGE